MSFSKQISRNIDNILIHPLQQKGIQLKNSMFFIDKFRNSFTEFVSILGGMIGFIESFDTSVNELPNLCLLLQDVCDYIYFRPPFEISLQSFNLGILSASPFQMNAKVIQVDQLLVFFKKLAYVVKAKDPDPDYDDPEYLNYILSHIEHKFVKLDEHVHELESKFDALGVIEDAQGLKRKAEENEEYKMTLRIESDRKKEEFCANLLNEIRNLFPKYNVHENDNVITQLNCVISGVRDEIQEFDSKTAEFQECLRIISKYRKKRLGLETTEKNYCCPS